jgi:hypothetical protein
VGFAAAGSRKHWAGDTDAYIGELVVAAEHTERGVGRARRCRRGLGPRFRLRPDHARDWCP